MRDQNHMCIKVEDIEPHVFKVCLKKLFYMKVSVKIQSLMTIGSRIRANEGTMGGLTGSVIPLPPVTSFCYEPF